MNKGALRLVPKYQPDVEVSEQALPRILHVEDDPLIARAVGSLLRRAGYEVVAASTASAAISELDRRRFDVILSDFNLADGSTGAEVLACAGATPFVFLSSDDRAEGHGVPRLEKPCSPMELRCAIRLATGGESFQTDPSPNAGEGPSNAGRHA